MNDCFIHKRVSLNRSPASLHAIYSLELTASRRTTLFFMASTAFTRCCARPRERRTPVRATFETTRTLQLRATRVHTVFAAVRSRYFHRVSLMPYRTSLEESGQQLKPTPSGAPLTETPDTFCVMPWLYLQLFSHGNVKPCCKFARFLIKDSAPMSVYKQPLQEIWNSADVRSIRRSMVRGERVSGCAGCYQEEEAGGVSLRKGSKSRLARRLAQ